MYFFSSATLATVALLAHQTLAQGASPGCGSGVDNPKNIHEIRDANDCHHDGNVWTCGPDVHVVVHDDKTITLTAGNGPANIILLCDLEPNQDYFCQAGKSSLFASPCENPKVEHVIVTHY
ncbi:hypothetical protein E4U55_001546 [Claviceps digitariae]|nr:hypothetical protein E4U55_001546 [Claviceps digitariae]